MILFNREICETMSRKILLLIGRASSEPRDADIYILEDAVTETKEVKKRY